MMNNNSNPNINQGNRLKAYAAAIITAVLTISLGSLALATIYTQTEISTSTLEILQLILLALAGLLAGITCSKNIHKDGIVNGAILGVLIFAAMFAYNGYEFQLITLAMKVGIIIISTILGGIIGV